jgi:uncharacterized protein YbjT (DUF2867 family)
MMFKPRIMLTGATGTIGRELVKLMMAKGQDVRVLARDVTRARALHPRLDVVPGDLTNPETLKGAFEGAERVLLLTNGTEMEAMEQNALAAIEATRSVKRVVHVSGRHLDAPFLAGSPLARAHQRAEDRLREMQVEWTIIRPGYFSSNTLMWIAPGRDEVVLPVGDGADTPIDPRDVAEVAYATLTERGHAGRIYEITGPEYVSYADMIARTGKALGRPLKLVDAPGEAVLEGLVSAGVPRLQAEGLVRYWEEGVRRHAVYPPTNTIEEILGRPPRSFDQWLADHVSASGT